MCLTRKPQGSLARLICEVEEGQDDITIDKGHGYANKTSVYSNQIASYGEYSPTDSGTTSAME
jgi:hypothetical protein